MTPELEQFLKTELRKAAATVSAPVVKTLFRLYTEDVDRARIVETVKAHFDGATIYSGIGLDARTQARDENALIIEIVSSKSDARAEVLALARDIRALSDQISVLVTEQSVTTLEVYKA